MNAIRPSTSSTTTRSGLRGYQWKCLFLPDSTELRMYFGGDYFYAQVVGDAIMYEGQRVSPRQLTIAIAGAGRNAWRDLWLLQPGETKWKRASLLRREIEKQGVQPPVSPVENMAAAAEAMSTALKAALALVEHSNAQLARKYERRVNRARRADDYLAESCQLD